MKRAFILITTIVVVIAFVSIGYDYLNEVIDSKNNAKALDNFLNDSLPVPNDFKPQYSNLKATGFDYLGCYTITAIVDIDSSNTRAMVDNNAKYIMRQLYIKHKLSKAFMLKVFTPGVKMAYYVVTLAPNNEWVDPCKFEYNPFNFTYQVYYVDWFWNNSRPLNK